MTHQIILELYYWTTCFPHKMEYWCNFFCVLWPFSPAWSFAEPPDHPLDHLRTLQISDRIQRRTVSTTEKNFVVLGAKPVQISIPIIKFNLLRDIACMDSATTNLLDVNHSCKGTCSENQQNVLALPGMRCLRENDRRCSDLRFQEPHANAWQQVPAWKENQRMNFTVWDVEPPLNHDVPKSWVGLVWKLLGTP